MALRPASVARIERSEIRDGTCTRLRRLRVSLALDPGYDTDEVLDLVDDKSVVSYEAVAAIVGQTHAWHMVNVGLLRHIPKQGFAKPPHATIKS
jgi:hypothetical protein